MTAVSPQDAAPERSPILRVLRVGLHVMFAVLLGLGLVRTFFPANVVTAPPMHHRLIITLMVVILALVYVLGTSREYRWHRHDTGPAPRVSTMLGWAWLSVITVLWLALLFFSPVFVWVAFPLMFLYLYLLGNIAGVLAVVGLWAATWLLPWWDAVRATGPQPPDVASIIGPGIGAVLAVLISAAYRYLLAQAAHHQRVAAALQATQADLAATEHRAGQLEERERIAREIHDTLAQGFSSIVLVSRAARQRHELPDATRQALGLIEETAATNLTEARGLVQHLSTADPQTSLSTQLEQLAARYETELAVRNQPLRTHLRWEGEQSPAQLPQPISAAVLRTVQVGLGNVAAHAHATQAVITVGIWHEELTVDIFDDGVGFTVPDRFSPGFTTVSPPSEEHTGYGLYGLQQRLTALNGSLTVESAPGGGTVLAARIPLTSATSQPITQESS
ncbi:MAG TPA: sensor histidine kinase [Enteractinococcus sp.]